MYLKSAAMLFFKSSANRYGLGLSNELLFIIIGQGAAKLWPVKVGDLKRNLTFLIRDQFYSVYLTWPDTTQTGVTPALTGHTFVAP